MGCVLLVFVIIGMVAGAKKEKFPTYYMEQTCGTTISGHESARIEISTGLLYKRNMNCKLTITVPNGVDMFLYFKRFSLEKQFRGKCLDYLNMYKGPTTAAVLVNSEPMCGEKIPWTMSIEASTLLLHFVSDRSADDMGFEIIYAASRSCLGLANNSSLRCGDDDICFDNSLICDRVQQCQDGRDESNCTVPAPQPDELIPIIAGSTVGGTAGFMLLVLLGYLLYQYIQERRFLRQCEDIKLDTYPITDRYRIKDRPTTFLGSSAQLRGRSSHALKQREDTSLGRESVTSTGTNKSAVNAVKRHPNNASPMNGD